MKKLFMLACAGVLIAVCCALWVGKDDMRRYWDMRKM